MKALKYFTCIVLFALTSRIYSQIPDTIWTKTFGGPLADVGNSVKQTNDGGFIAAGTTSSFGAGGQDVFLIKTDGNGDTLWTKTFGGTGNDRAANVVQTNDNGYAILGTTNSFGNGGDDFLLWKTDSLGNTEWFKTYGTNSNEVGNEGIQTSDNGYILIGNINDAFQKSLIIKLDSSGNETWSKVIVNYLCPTLAYSVTQTNDSGYAICGSWYYWIPRDYVYKSYMYKFSSSGDSLVMKSYDFTIREIPKVVRNTYDGNLILGGITDTYGQKSRLLKVTQDGDIIWTKEIDGSQDPDYLNSLEQDFDNGFVFTIVCNGNPPYGADFGLIKCDIDGDFLWEKRIGGPEYDFAHAVYPTNDSGYVVVGETKSFGAGDNDVWLMKFRYPPPPEITVTYPNGGEHWMMWDTAQVEWTASGVDSVKIELSLSDGIDWMTIAESVPNTGTFDWFVQAPFTSWYCLMKISDTNDSTIFDISDTTFTIDMFPAVEDSSGLFPDEFALLQNYPNPFNPSTVISFQLPVSGRVTLKVYDVLGNEIATLVNEEKQPGIYEAEFNTSSIKHLPSSGIYFYQLKVGNFIETKKMVLIK